MPPVIVKASTKSINNSTTIKCESRGFTITLEQTKEEPDKNSSMNPMEAILCSLGGCVVITAINYASKHNIKLNDISVELEGDFDTDEVRCGYKDIACKVILDTAATDHQVYSLIKSINQSAPVVDTIINPVKLSIETVVKSNH